jgi:ABC-type glutathione transport system ATPase component
VNAAKTGDAVLEVRDVSVVYEKGAPPALEGVSVAVRRGVAVGIVGESGSGKSTLARVLVNERRPTKGEAFVFGKPWTAVAQRGRERSAVQMIFQDPYGALNPRMTPASAVAEAVAVRQSISMAKAQGAALDLLGEVGLSGEVVQRRPANLSGGQRQRVVIARALACEPEVLVADEPTSALDVSVQAQILNLLLRLRADRDLSLVLISHDMAVVNHLTDEVVVMLNGRVVETGQTEEVLTNPVNAYTRRLIEAFEVGGADVHDPLPRASRVR